jgi:transcriptional regulator with XRE-family HTH domain
MNTIGNKIRLLREERGLSQENMASALEMTQSNYARLEKDDNRISVPRLIIIAKTLETTVTEIVGEKPNTVVNQNTQRDAFAYFQSNFQADREHIQTLKDENAYLKKMLEKVMER